MGKFSTKTLPMLFILSLVTSLTGCTGKEKQKTYFLMEKQLADIKGRKRTTAKIVIQNTEVSRQRTEEIMKQALQDLKKDDPSLDAVLIWAYKNKSELNQTFTLGKLEWSKDKKGWEGKQNLQNEIITEVVR